MHFTIKIPVIIAGYLTKGIGQKIDVCKISDEGDYDQGVGKIGREIHHKCRVTANLGTYGIGRISLSAVIARHEAICKHLTYNRLLRAYQ